MLNLLTAAHSTLSKLLPFATPGTPLLQDVLHLLALCTALYYAPQIQEFAQQRLGSRRARDRTWRDVGAEHQVDAVDHADGVRGWARGDGDANADADAAVDAEAEAGAGAGAAHFPPPHAAAVEDDEPIAVAPDLLHEDRFPDADAEAGPAGPRATPRTREVGAKKAKSLARRDQRRAYHEFQRSQGEAQRAREAEGAREREELAAREKARREEVEAEVEARRVREREERRERERRGREEEEGRRQGALGMVREEVRVGGACELEGVARRVGSGVDRAWVERLVRASGMLEVAANEVTLLTETGWVVRVSREDMNSVYRAVLEGAVAGSDSDDGQVSHVDIGTRLAARLQEMSA